MTQLPLIAHPTLRQFTIGAHAVLAAWLLINGVAHEIGVMVGARAGTLSPHASVPSLLVVGAGLIVAGAAVAAGIAPLARASGSALWSAFAGVATLALVITGTALAYGTTFLRGTIALGVLDAALLIAHKVLNDGHAARGV